MMKPKQIKSPEIKSGRVLSAMELNSLKFTDKHTILTPELLESRKQANEVLNKPQ